MPAVISATRQATPKRIGLVRVVDGDIDQLPMRM